MGSYESGSDDGRRRNKEHTWSRSMGTPKERSFGVTRVLAFALRQIVLFARIGRWLFAKYGILERKRIMAGTVDNRVCESS